VIELEKFNPGIKVVQEACPMWVPLVENNEHEGHGANYFIKKNIDHLLKKDIYIDTIVLACTHYPLLAKKIEEYVPVGIKVISQGEIVAKSLADYLQRHHEIEERLLKNGVRTFYTTDSTEDFDNKASIFYGEAVASRHVHLV